MTNGKYDGLYFTARGGLGFVRLEGTRARAYPILFTARDTFDRWRDTANIPFKFMFEVELVNDDRDFGERE